MKRFVAAAALLAVVLALPGCSRSTAGPAAAEATGTASIDASTTQRNPERPFIIVGKDKLYTHVVKVYDPAAFPKTSMNGEPSDVPFFKPEKDEGAVNRDYPDYDSKTFKFLALPGGVIPPQDYYLFHKDGGTLNKALKGTGYKAVDILDSGHIKILPNLYVGYYDFAWVSVNVMTEYWSGHESMSRELWRDGNDYVIVAGSYNGGISLIAPPDVKDIKELQGQTVGIMNPAFNVEALLNKKLGSVGLSTESAGGDVKVVMGMPGFVMNDLLDKKLKAVFAWGLYEKQLRKASGYTELVPWTEMGYGKKMPYYVLVVRKDILAKHPEIVRKVVQLNAEATKQAVEVGDYKKADAPRYQHYWSYFMGNPNAGSRSALVEPDALPNPVFLRDVYDYMVKCGYFVTPYRYDELVDLSFAQEASK